MTLKSTLLSGAISAILMISPVGAGPYSDAERAISDAYAEYRKALFHTNQNNKPATELALTLFRTKWIALSAEWKSTPPPQYADDPQLYPTLEGVAKIIDEAKNKAQIGNLSQSHDVLESIRDLLGEMRARNGVITFSDRMNAYHAHMEHVLERVYPTTSELGEDVAILAFLVRGMENRRPQGVDAIEFDQALKAVEASVGALRNAIKSGEPNAIESARKALKGPYSRMFLRFG